MIVPDLNLAIYAYNSEAQEHVAARRYWLAMLSGSEPFGLTTVVTGGFVRIVTNARMMNPPFTTEEAFNIVESWLAQPAVVLVEPRPRHFGLFADLMRRSGGGHRLVTDAILAALAVERGATLHSRDRDFARWPELRWADPLVS